MAEAERGSNVRKITGKAGQGSGLFFANRPNMEVSFTIVRTALRKDNDSIR